MPAAPVKLTARLELRVTVMPVCMAAAAIMKKRKLKMCILKVCVGVVLAECFTEAASQGRA